MPRVYTPVKAAIWQDDDWRSLTPGAQHLYLVLLTSPGLSFAGVGDWRPRRLLPLARGWRMNDFTAAADELSQELLIVIDQDTEEYLVRSFLRHDGVMQHNKTCISAMNAFSEIASNTLRGVVVHELRRLREEFPDWPCWDRNQVREVLKRRAVAPGVAPRSAPGLAPAVAPRSAPAVAATPAPDPAPGVAPEVDQDQDQEPQNQQPARAKQPSGLATTLTGHGLTDDEQTHFIAHLQRQGNVRSVAAVVAKMHRDGTLAGRVADWRLERDATRVTPLRKKGPDVGVQEWMLRG